EREKPGDCLPEGGGVALDQRSLATGYEGRIGLAQVGEKFAHRLVALSRKRMHRLAQSAIDPVGHARAETGCRYVGDSGLGSSSAGPSHTIAVGQTTGEHLVGDHSERKEVRTFAAAVTE